MKQSATIFISYSRQDVEFARRLTQQLKASGANVWLDVVDIPTGVNWSRAIQEALESCTLLLLLVTPASMESENVATEWQFFWDERKPIIPLVLEPSRPHFQLRRLQHITFHQVAFDAAFAKLHEQLQAKGFALQPLARQDDVQAAPQPEVTTETAVAEVEATLAALGIDAGRARLKTEEGYGWSFRQGRSIVEVYFTLDEGKAFMQSLVPMFHLPPAQNEALFRRLLEINLQLTNAALGVYLDVVYLYNEQPLKETPLILRQRTIQRLADYADDLAERLVTQFGGRLYSQI